MSKRMERPGVGAQHQGIHPQLIPNIDPRVQQQQHAQHLQHQQHPAFSHQQHPQQQHQQQHPQQQQHQQQQPHDAFLAPQPSPRNKRRVSGPQHPQPNAGPQFLGQPFAYGPPPPAPMIPQPQMQPPPQPQPIPQMIPQEHKPMQLEHQPPAPSATEQPPAKKSRTNTPWTAAEEQRLKNMREAGNSWAEIAKTFPQRTEGSVKKHWYKDMHYADFAEDEVRSRPAFLPFPAGGGAPGGKPLPLLPPHFVDQAQSQALLNAIKEYENNKWKEIGKKLGKPAKACEQYAREHFGNKA